MNEKLNQNSPKGINFFPFALGKKKKKKFILQLRCVHHYRT